MTTTQHLDLILTGGFHDYLGSTVSMGTLATISGHLFNMPSAGYTKLVVLSKLIMNIPNG